MVTYVQGVFYNAYSQKVRLFTNGLPKKSFTLHLQ